MFNLNIDLKARIDKNKRKYYVGKIKGPFSIDLTEGATFLIFVSEDGNEQLQIAPFESNNEY